MGGAAYSIDASSSSGTERTWQFTVTDGESWLTVVAHRTDNPQAPLGLPVPIPKGLPAGASANTTFGVADEGSASKYYQGSYPRRRRRRPAAHVASMMERWRAYASPEYASLGPRRWGFQVTCLRIMSSDCRNVWVTAWAGHADATGATLALDQVRDAADPAQHERGARQPPHDVRQPHPGPHRGLGGRRQPHRHPARAAAGSGGAGPASVSHPP